jgi:gamma-glutamyltranspeptidase / glutathione hydrolase
MSRNRREFLKQGFAAASLSSVMGIAASTSKADGPQKGQIPFSELARQGPKPVVRGKRAVVSTQHPIVTQTMLDVLKSGGNAADATVAGAITQATIQLDVSNLTAAVEFLYWEAKTGKTYQLNSVGTLVPYLPPCRPYPPGLDALADGMACIPGFMPGMQAIHSRFGTKPWKSLVEYAIPWAENGYPLDNVAHSDCEFELQGNTFFPSMREIYAPNGFPPAVGELWKNPKVAKTLRRLADEGSEYFLKGEWARNFVDLAHRIGWDIKLEDLSNNPPRWQDPIRFTYKGYEIVQLAPPERQGIFCSLVLGILKHLDITSLGHYTESAQTLYYFAHALRRAEFEVGLVRDPEFFGVPVELWTDDDFHSKLAQILRATRPKTGVDLTKHVELTSGRANLQAFGWSSSSTNVEGQKNAGSCEISCVDADGNWVQMMHTLNSGGIPGMAVDGVPMFGTGAEFDMRSSQEGWLGLPGSRIRNPLGSTIVFKNGKPFHSMGSPGHVECTVPQMLSDILDYGKDPYEAATLPRFLPMRDDYTIEIEARIPEPVLRDLVKLGAKLKPLPPYDFHMGSYQQAWRDPSTGLLCASTDPRRGGQAGGLDA